MGVNNLNKIVKCKIIRNGQLIFNKISAMHFSGEKVCLYEEKEKKKGNAKECSNYHTVEVISHAGKVMSKFSKWGFNSTWTVNMQMFKLDLEKVEEPEIKLPTSTGSWKKKESSRKTSISALLTTPKPLTVWITTNWKILQEMGIPDHRTCLLRNLYAGQEATVGIGYGTTDWFQIGKWVRQGCILSPCLFNFYEEYIMRNAGLE